MGIDGMWLFAEGVEFAQTVTFPKAGPVEIELALSVPAATNEFDVRHRGVSKGKAILEPPAPKASLPQAISARQVDRIEMSRTRTWTPADSVTRVGVLVTIRLGPGAFAAEDFVLAYKAPLASKSVKGEATAKSHCRGYEAGRGAWAITDAEGKGFQLFTGNPTTDIDFLFEVERKRNERGLPAIRA